MADLAMAVVSVPCAGTGLCDAASVGEIRWASPSGFEGILAYRRFSLNTHNFLDEALFIPSTQWALSPPSMLELPGSALVGQAISDAVSHITRVATYPSKVEPWPLFCHFPHVSQQCGLRSVFSGSKFLFDQPP